MSKYRALEVTVGAVLLAGLLAGAAMAQKEDKGTVTPPDCHHPRAGHAAEQVRITAGPSRSRASRLCRPPLYGQ
jgi:hypothetical protein